MICLQRSLEGSILDIGGGGEGIIGQLYGDQVTVIDHSQEELDEAPVGCCKILMDAQNLLFPGGHFDHVTFFYSLMYMTEEEQRIAVREAYRVLRPGGTVSIWDCEINTAYPDPFCIDLDISLPGRLIHTTYGIGKLDTQSFSSVCKLCAEAGLELIDSHRSPDGFYLYAGKRKNDLY